VTTSPSQGNGGVRYFSCRTAEERDKWVHRYIYIITFDVLGVLLSNSSAAYVSLKIIAPQTLTQTTGFATYLLLNICFSCETSTLCHKKLNHVEQTSCLGGEGKNYFLLFQTMYRERELNQHTLPVFSQHLCKFVENIYVFGRHNEGQRIMEVLS
jgi:hypothetical protein